MVLPNLGQREPGDGLVEESAVVHGLGTGSFARFYGFGLEALHGGKVTRKVCRAPPDLLGKIQLEVLPERHSVRRHRLKPAHDLGSDTSRCCQILVLERRVDLGAGLPEGSV